MHPAHSTPTGSTVCSRLISASALAFRFQQGDLRRAIIGIISSATLAVSALHGAPTITAQPTHTSVNAGQSATLSVSATGTGSLSYQWKRNGFSIPGATAAALTIANSTARDNGYYRVDVSDVSGSTASAVTFVTVVYNAAHVFGWGSNLDGESTVPAGLTNVVSVAAGREHGLALQGDGTVVKWGGGFAGSVPVDLTDVVAISAGGWSSLALKRDGTVVGWGRLAPPRRV